MIVYMFERAFKLMKKAPVKGCFVEFGVFQGDSLIQTIKMATKYLGKNIDFYGFDSFKGMPPTKVPLTQSLGKSWAKGTFSDTSFDFVKKRLKKERLKATLVKGVFSKLKPLSSYGISKIRFANIDADIYEGYRDALELITPYIQIGTVILFDECIAPSDYRYQGIKLHATRAIQEWEKKTSLNLHLIRFKWTNGLCVVVDEKYLKKHGSFIESLRNDNIAQSLMDILHQFSQRLGI